MTRTFLDDPRHWRDRAETTWVKAEQCGRGESKQRMLRIANEYDRLADHAADRARSEGVLEEK